MVFGGRHLMPGEVPVEDVWDGPREHLAFQMAENETVLLRGPVVRHGLHRVLARCAVRLVAVAHPATLFHSSTPFPFAPSQQGMDEPSTLQSPRRDKQNAAAGWIAR